WKRFSNRSSPPRLMVWDLVYRFAARSFGPTAGSYAPPTTRSAGLLSLSQYLLRRTQTLNEVCVGCNSTGVCCGFGALFRVPKNCRRPATLSPGRLNSPRQHAPVHIPDRGGRDAERLALFGR